MLVQPGNHPNILFVSQSQIAYFVAEAAGRKTGGTLNSTFNIMEPTGIVMLESKKK
jgi:hypothetical protein